MRILLALEALQFYSDYVRRALLAHDVRTMGSHACDVVYRWDGGSFNDALATLPPDWTPDLVIFWFPENTVVPPGVEECPYPTVAVTSDVNFNTEALRQTVPMFDAVVSDTYGLQVLGDLPGVQQFRGGYWAFDPQVHRRLPQVPTTYDVSVLGDLSMVQAERVRCLDAVSRLAGQWRVQFFNNAFDQETYVRYINSTRITINRTMRNEMNMRCFEVPACGSLLFCESSNLEIRDYLIDREQCVLFEPDNVVDLIEHYLRHEDERARLAAAGHEAIQRYTYEKQIAGLLRRLEGLQVGPRAFLQHPACYQHAVRAAQSSFFTSGEEGLKRSLLEVERGLALTPRNAELLNGYGCVLATLGDRESDPERRQDLYRRADEAFSRVPGLGALPRTSHANLLLRMGQSDRARALLESALHEPLVMTLSFYPRALDRFSLEWGRNRHLQEKLVRWHVCWLLADLCPPQRVEYLRLAVEARPDIGHTWYLLAAALPPHSDEQYQALHQAVAWDPLLLPARYDLLGEERIRNPAAASEMATLFARFLTAFPYPTSELEKLSTLLSNRI